MRPTLTTNVFTKTAFCIIYKLTLFLQPGFSLKKPDELIELVDGDTISLDEMYSILAKEAYVSFLNLDKKITRDFSDLHIDYPVSRKLIDYVAILNRANNGYAIVESSKPPHIMGDDFVWVSNRYINDIIISLFPHLGKNPGINFELFYTNLNNKQVVDIRKIHGE